MENSKNCTKCAAQIPQNASICPVCGANQSQPTTEQFQQPVYNQQPNNQNNQNNQQYTQNNNSKSKGTTALLAILAPFFGFCGIHRFYTGHIGIGLIQLFTGGGCLIWQTIDIIMILTGSYKDADGKPLKV